MCVFLSLLQITNQLVLGCKRSINAYLTQYSQRSPNNVWSAIENYISQSEDNALNESPVKARKGAQPDAIAKQDFLAILSSCLLLHKQYQDQLRHLKDSLGGSHGLSHISAASFSNSAKKYTSPSFASLNIGTFKPLAANTSPNLMCELQYA